MVIVMRILEGLAALVAALYIVAQLAQLWRTRRNGKWMVVVMVCILPVSSHAANYWNFGFDCLTPASGACLTSNGQIDQVSNAVLDTTEKHSGTGSMQLTVTNAQGDTGIKPLNSYTLDRTLPVYYRWWMKMDAAYRWGTGNQLMKLNRVKQWNDQLGFSLTNHWRNNGIGLSECDTCTPQGSGGDDVMNVTYDFNPATNAALSSWHEYIVEFRFSTGGGTAPGVLDSSNAVMKLYVDGALVSTAPEAVSLCCRAASIANSTEENAREAWGGMGVNTFPQLNCLGGDPVCGGTIWIDDVSTDTTWNSSFVDPPADPPIAFVPTVSSRGQVFYFDVLLSAVGVLWHVRHAMLSGVLAVWMVGGCMVSWTAQKTKQIGYTAALVTLAGASIVMQKVTRR